MAFFKHAHVCVPRKDEAKEDETAGGVAALVAVVAVWRYEAGGALSREWREAVAWHPLRR